MNTRYGTSVHNETTEKSFYGSQSIFRAVPCLLSYERNTIMEKYITKNGIQYELRGEQYYPMLALGEQTDYKIGKYGRMCLDYLKNHRRGTYITLLSEGRLNEYLHEIDIQAREQINLIVDQMSARMDITERLKSADPLRWAKEMNSIKASAEEIILAEIVYC